MKNLFLVIIGIVLLSVYSACNSGRVKPPEKVFEMYEDYEGARYYSLPPVIAGKVIPDEDNTRDIKVVLKDVNHLKALTLDVKSSGTETFDELKKQLDAYIVKNNMQEMIHITHKGEEISINMREDNGKLREVLVCVYGDEGFKGLTMEGDLTMENIIKLVNNMDFSDFEKLLNH